MKKNLIIFMFEKANISFAIAFVCFDATTVKSTICGCTSSTFQECLWLCLIKAFIVC